MIIEVTLVEFEIFLWVFRIYKSSFTESTRLTENFFSYIASSRQSVEPLNSL